MSSLTKSKESFVENEINPEWGMNIRYFWYHSIFLLIYLWHLFFFYYFGSIINCYD